MLGSGLAYIILCVTIVQVLASWKGTRAMSRAAAGATLTLSLFAFSLIVVFHVRISSLLPLVEPFSGAFVGNYAIPPWVESERLLFWLLLFATASLLVTLRAHRSRGTEIGAALLLVVMALAMATVTNPFSPPLPGFHDELTAYASALSSGDPRIIGEAFGRSYGKMIGYYNSTYMWIHPPLLFISYAAVALTFLGSIQGLRGEVNGAHIAYSAAKAGFLALTLGLLLGYPWALQAWDGTPWWWDPKISMSLMVWVMLSAYLHARIYRGRSPGVAGLTHWLGVATFVALLLTYLSTYIIPGIHSTAG